MSSAKTNQRYDDLRESLAALPHITPAQVDQWVNLQKSIDASRDYLIRAVPQAQQTIDEAQKILAQRTYSLVFFGGTGVGKSTLINALLGRNLLPTGAVTAVTGTIVYIEQADEEEAESLTLEYWSKDEFAERVRRLCHLAQIPAFDITGSGERKEARQSIEEQLNGNRESAKTERDEYLEILIDCLDSYEANEAMYKKGAPPPRSLSLDDAESLKHLREDGFKGSKERQIRLIKSATFRIRPRAGQPNLLMNGYLRIVDVPGLGAGMRLHEEITLEEMKREDAMIVLVTDAGRQRVDEIKSLSAVNWIKENRLFGLSGGDLDQAAAKIFLAVNGANIRQAFDRLNAGLPGSELEVKEVTRYIAPNYWERYAQRGRNRPYFLIMAPPALYVQDPDNAPAEFASETERILKVFDDQLGPIDSDDPLHPDTKEALLELSEVPLLRQRLIEFIQNERVRMQLREAASRVRGGLQSLRFYYEKQLAGRGIHPPFTNSWESIQERRYENLLSRQQKELPRLFHNALLDLHARTSSDDQFRALLQPTLNGVKSMVQDTVQREVENLLENYGTEHWDDRDVTYDNLIWGTSGIEIPIKRILYQVELVMQEAVSNFMPEVADVVADELERVLEAHDLFSRLQRVSYGQEYEYALPGQSEEALDLQQAYERIVRQVGQNFRHVCQQATMCELVRPERSIHARVEAGAQELALPEDDRLLDVVLHGVDIVRRQLAAQAQALGESEAASRLRRAVAGSPAEAEPAAPEEEEFTINILDGQETAGEVEITMPEEALKAGQGSLEMSYADKLDNIALKTNQIFSEIIDDLFMDDQLLPRLRRLFWLEATRAERNFNNQIVKPMLRQHDRRLHDETLRQAMEVDLESMSEVEELMRIWEGLHKLENEIPV